MEELVEKSKKGNNQAFSELIIRIENELYKIARTRLRNEEDIKIVLTLFYLEEFSTKEIAKILKEPEATIRTRLSRARNKLKKIIEGGY